MFMLRFRYKYLISLAHVHIVTDKYYVSLAMPEDIEGAKKDDKQLTVAEAEARAAAMTPAQRAVLAAKMKLKKDAE